MWATPTNVDLKALCRAHHVPFQQVSALSDLLPALATAWTLNAPSVIEVVTDRRSNVQVHRDLQAQATAAASRALELRACAPAHPDGPVILAGAIEGDRGGGAALNSKPVRPA
jgi:hypothetical protein